MKFLLKIWDLDFDHACLQKYLELEVYSHSKWDALESKYKYASNVSQNLKLI